MITVNCSPKFDVAKAIPFAIIARKITSATEIIISQCIGESIPPLMLKKIVGGIEN